jgi:WD40 repeat protein
LEVLAGTSNGTIYRLNVADMQHITIAEAHTGRVIAVAFSSFIRDRFATAADDGTIRVWDVTDYIIHCTARALPTQPRGVLPLCLGFSDALLSGWNDGRVLAHDPDTGANLWFIDSAHQDEVTALCISHNNRFLLTGGVKGEVRLWELRTRDLVSHLKEHVQKVTSITLSEDDTVAFSGSRDRCVLRWDLKLERRIHCHMQRMGGINCIALSLSESNVLSVGQERKLTYWDNASERFAHQVALDKDNDEGRGLAISHDGRLIATGGTAGILRIWSYESGTLISSHVGHSGTINGVAFSADDRQIVSVGDDGCAFVWSVFTNE